jgi:hypothetical protein
MSTRTAVKADRKTTHLVVASQRRTPHHRVASPRKAGEKTGPSRSLDALAEPGSGHDFSRIRVYPEQGHQSGRTVSGVCPLGISIPAFCPFGGACHTCPSRVQAKLTVGRPDDKYEREADRVADKTARRADHPVGAETDRGGGGRRRRRKTRPDNTDQSQYGPCRSRSGDLRRLPQGGRRAPCANRARFLRTAIWV